MKKPLLILAFVFATLSLNAADIYIRKTNGVSVYATPSSGITAVSDSGVITLGSITISNITASTTLALGVGSIELGHASDTTLARSGAGDITIEGNAIYRAGGTDVPVTDGGTGRSTGTTAYALVATGTTATGAQQTLASGATTEILVGGGAAALPVWTTATGTGAPVRASSPTLTGTPALGAATATSINGNIFTTGSSTYTGTAGQTYTFPTTTATIARTDAAQTFTGTQTFGGGNTLMNTVLAVSSNLPFQTRNTGTYEWATTNATDPSDLFLSKASAGVLRIGTTNSNALGSLQLANITISSLTASKPVFTDASKVLISGSYSVPQIVGSGNVLAATATNASVATYTTPNDSTVHSFSCGGYVNITAISAGTLTVQMSFTDENNAAQTLTYFAMGVTSSGLTTTGFTGFAPMYIRCKDNTAITFKTSFTGVSITYDAGGTLEALY